MNISTDLFNATSLGNLEAVKELFDKYPRECSANYIHIAPIRGNEQSKSTLLSTAVKTGNLELVKFLIMKGAEVCVEKPKDVNSLGLDAIATFIQIGDEKINPDILKILFANSSNDKYTSCFVPSRCVPVAGDLTKLYAVAFGNEKLNNGSVGYSSQKILSNNTCFSHFFHESILRCNKIALEKLIQCVRTFELNATTMEQYVSERNFDLQSSSAACNAIDFLVEKLFIEDKIAPTIKKAIENKVIAKIKIEDFPVQVQEHLKKTSVLSLHQLFSKIQTLLFPFKTGDEIRQAQGLHNLHSYLRDDNINQVVALFAKRMNMKGENEAAFLLAEILLVHSGEVVEIEGKKDVLMSNEDKKQCLKIIKAIFSLSKAELMQNSSNAELESQITLQQNEISQLKEQSKRQEEMISELTKKIEMIVAVQKAFLSRSSEVATSKPGA